MNGLRFARLFGPMLLSALVMIGSGITAGPAGAEPRAVPPPVVLHNLPFSVTVSDPDLADGTEMPVVLQAGGFQKEVVLTGSTPVSVEGLVLARGESLSLSAGGRETRLEINALPGWVSLAPPLVAILLAILFRQAILALFIGVWLGAILIFQVDPLTGFLRAADTYLVNALADRDHVMILAFTFAMGGMLGVVARAGGTRGIVELLAPLARGPRSAQVSSWALGLVVFFDDYANTLLVGNTMRPLTDRMKISREKLAYIVDSTAAPVASIAIVSTWIGVEVSLIGDSFASLGIERDAFGAFVASLPYRFYPIFALAFGFMVASSGRDFGPMLKAERRARRTGQSLRPGSVPLANFDSTLLEPPAGKPIRWVTAALPLAVMVGGILWFLYSTGRASTLASGGTLDLKSILGNADSYSALVWASFLGSAVAILLAVGQRILTLHEVMEAWIEGAKSIITAAVILTLAWSISEVAGVLGTSTYLVDLLSEALSPHWLPMLVFLISGLASFATGSSWGTMGILMPLVIPLAHNLAPGSDHILVGTISSVLAGSVWGDHCSPISDTTVLSSMASAVDHMDHVNTQLPYALTVGAVGILLGEIPTAFGVPYVVSWVLGLVTLAVILRFVGRPVEAA